MITASMSVLVDVKPVSSKGKSPTTFEGITQLVISKTAVALFTVKVVFLGVGASKLAVAACEAVIVVVPALTIVTVMPEMVATDKLELV